MTFFTQNFVFIIRKGDKVTQNILASHWWLITEQNNVSDYWSRWVACDREPKKEKDMS